MIFAIIAVAAEPDAAGEREVCPPVRELWEARRTGFADIRGAALDDTPGAWRSTVQVPDAVSTTVTADAAVVVFEASGGGVEAGLGASELMVRPCLPTAWSLRADEGDRPRVLLGREQADGWHAPFGELDVTSDQQVRLVIYAGDAEPVYRPLSVPREKGAFTRAVDAVLAAAPGGFVDERGADLGQGRYAARHPLPGADRCGVLDDDAGARYACTFAPRSGSESVYFLHARAQQQVGHALGEGWSYWLDPDPGEHGLRTAHYARRTSRAPEQAVVVTVAPLASMVVVSVSRERVE